MKGAHAAQKRPLSVPKFFGFLRGVLKAGGLDHTVLEESSPVRRALALALFPAPPRAARGTPQASWRVREQSRAYQRRGRNAGRTPKQTAM